MTPLIRYLIVLLLFTSAEILTAQVNEGQAEQVLTFEEYLAYVKSHHPIMKQANLTLNVGEATLLRARGGFDPKIEVDYNRKKFKGTEYYDQLNAVFKIPTWYGVEFKANFEENTGQFLNPQLTVPDGGLYSAGISLSLLQDLLINDRMASLRKARFFREQTKAERDLMVNNLLYEASLAYFQWLEAFQEQKIYEIFLDNARQRLNAVVRSVDMGDKAAIDITEARIALQNRELNLEAANLKRQKAMLNVSNFLWLNGIPLEIEDGVNPVSPNLEQLSAALLIEGITNTQELINSHPKLRSLDYKIKGLTVDRSLKRNKLLPRLDLQYNFLSQNYEQINSFNTANYKAFLNVSFPLFLRKERGDVRLGTLKLQDANFERLSASLNIQNKIDATNAEILSLETQSDLISDIVIDYETLVKAEERKFFMGESSLFLINSREQKLIEAQLKKNKLSVEELKATANLYNALGLSSPIETTQ